MDSPNLLFEMVGSYLSFFEIYDDVQMREFMVRNNGFYFNSKFLDLIRCFVVDSKKGKMLSKDQVCSILNKIFDIMFSFPEAEERETYEYIKSCCDLIISISNMYMVDFTKKILSIAKGRQLTSEGVFLSSLLMLYYFKLREEERRKLSEKPITDGFIEQQIYYKNYQQLMNNYQTPGFFMKEIS